MISALVEPLEDHRLFVGWDPRATVDHLERDRAVGRVPTNGCRTGPSAGENFTALWTRFVRIWISRLGSTSIRVGRIRPLVELDPGAVVAERRDDLREHAAHLDLVRFEHELAGLDPGDDEQVVDELDQPVGLRQHDAEVLVALARR